MWKKLLLALALLSLHVSAAGQSVAVEVPVRHFLLSCATNSNVECIKSITVISSSGFRSTSSAPTRTLQVRGSLNDIDTREEWTFPGFTFEGSAGNRLIPGFAYRPLGSDQCAHGICIEGIEELQIGIEASWINRTPDEEKTMEMDLKHRESKLLCGEISAPRTCVRAFNFNQVVSFEVELQMPIEFSPVAFFGSVKNLEYKSGKEEVLLNGQKFREISLKFSSQKLQQVLFSDLLPKPMDSSQYADFESDRVNFWLLGSRSSQVKSLGKCSVIPFITILSNSIYSYLPRWNESSQAIEVDLQAPHFAVDGSVQTGYFEATISKAMGSCLWGIDLSTKSTAKMTITYSGDSGPEVQTVSGRFDGENYILFSANFHYSSPRISLKMQDAPPVPVRVSETKVKTIKCAKGKLIKVLKGQSPKCPVGYKKK